MTGQAAHNNLEFDSEDDEQGVAPSAIAEKLAKLKSATVAAAASRSRLPQPLFWSLFHAELKEVKREKELARALDSLFGSK